MRRWVLAIAVGLVLGLSIEAHAQRSGRLALCSTAPANVHRGMFTGSDMTRMGMAELRTLVAGFVNGATIAPLLGAGDDCVRRIVNACFVGRELDQLVAIVRAYLTSNPTEWHDGANAILYRSLVVQCVDRS